MDGLSLADGLLLPPSGPFACHRLRVIKLARMNLAGEIPKVLGKCVWLQVLELQDNWLRGRIPETLCRCTQLYTLALHGNALSGQVPAEGLAKLTSLAMLTLGGELGGNDELFISQSGAEVKPSQAHLQPVPHPLFWRFPQ